MFYGLVKPLLFSMDPEKAHDLIINHCTKYPLLGELVGRHHKEKKFHTRVGKNTWTFPVGLAAGLDKNASCIDFFDALGFGAIEVGTVTPKPQVGNDKPRLFRIKEESSLRNRMGFNNLGSDVFYENIKRALRSSTPVGVNIGKNKTTPNSKAFEDYQKLYTRFKDIADYIVVNVSSPNTPGLRDHQTKDSLAEILKNIGRESKNEVDLFVKISPDVEKEVVYDVVDLAKEYDVTGIIATNTTIMKNYGDGGVSGDLLFEKSRQIRSLCLEALKECPDISMIGVGGFSNFEQMKAYWKEGGNALQVYSSFIYQGPDLLKNVELELSDDMEKVRASNFSDYLEIIRE